MSSTWFHRRLWAAVSIWACGLAFSPKSWAQAQESASSVGSSVAEVTAIVSLVLVGCAAVVVLLWRRGAVVAVERDALANAFRHSRECKLVTQANGDVVAASAGWDDVAEFDAEAPLAHLENGNFVAADGEMDRLNRSASGGQSATTLLRPASGGGECRRLHAEPLSRSPRYIVWSLDDGPLLTETTTLAALTDDATTGVYSVDQDGRFLYSDATFAGWLGFDPGDLVVVGTILKDVLEGGEGSFHAPTGRLTFKRPDGTTFDAQYAQTIIPARSGSGFHTRTLVRDLSAIPADEISSQDADPRFRQLFEEAPTGIALLDADGHVLEGNAAFARLIGTEPGALDGRTLASLFAEEERAGVQEWLARVDTAAGQLISHEAHTLGGETPSGLHAGRFGDPSDHRVIVHILEPSESRNMDAQLLQTQKMELVGQLAGGVAHDFNNLLTAMIGFCDLLLCCGTIPRTHRSRTSRQIKQNANRAASLVRQLLAFSRQQTLQPRVISLTDVLDELKHLLRRLMGASIESHRFRSRVRSHPGLGTIRADQNQIESE